MLSSGNWENSTSERVFQEIEAESRHNFVKESAFYAQWLVLLEKRAIEKAYFYDNLPLC